METDLADNHTKHKKALIVGHPNVGKTTLFNYVTKSFASTGNWAGVTVDSYRGEWRTGRTHIELIDLPGIQTFSSLREGEEKVTREYLLYQQGYFYDYIFQVGDMNQLDRTLMLTKQLALLQKPMILLLTMGDISEKNGKIIDLEGLQKKIGIPIFEISGKKQQRKEELASLLEDSPPQIPSLSFALEPFDNMDLYDSLYQEVSALLPEPYRSLAHFFTVKFLEKETYLEQVVGSIPVSCLEIREAVFTDYKKIYGIDPFIVISRMYFEYIKSICHQYQIQNKAKYDRTHMLDKYFLHPYWGTLSFIFIIWLSFSIAIDIGGVFADFLDTLYRAFVFDTLGKLLQNHPIWYVLLVEGLATGIRAVISFIPSIFLLFFVMNFLQDSGYISRVTVIMDKFMRKIGLPGKVLAPIIMGFGCNVPSIAGMRILDTVQEKKLATMIIPFVSCGARLPVYTLMALVLFPQERRIIIPLLYFIGIAFAVLTAFLFFKLLFHKEERRITLMDLPYYHLPNLKMVYRYSIRQSKSLLYRAGRMILLMFAIFQILGRWDSHLRYTENIGDSLLAGVAKKISIVFHPMGIEQENWPATLGIINGLIAKENVVSTVISGYTSQQMNIESSSIPIYDASYLQIWGLGVQEAFRNLISSVLGYSDEQGFHQGLLLDPSFYIPFLSIFNFMQEEPDESTFMPNPTDQLDNKLIHSIQEGFSIVHSSKSSQSEQMLDPYKARIAGYAFLLFILLYSPCVSVASAVKKELGSKWMWIQIAYQNILAYIVATLFYQIMIHL